MTPSEADIWLQNLMAFHMAVSRMAKLLTEGLAHDGNVLTHRRQPTEVAEFWRRAIKGDSGEFGPLGWDDSMRMLELRVEGRLARFQECCDVLGITAAGRRKYFDAREQAERAVSQSPIETRHGGITNMTIL